MYLVIDIGGTYTKYGYYHQNGECIDQDKFPTIQTNIDEFYSNIIKLIKNDTEGIAISMPGLLDSESGYIEAITLLPFLSQHNIKEELEKRTHLHVSVENDAKCATLGEMWQGSLKDVQNGLMIVLGSGIGGTVILDGQIINSPRHKAGEIGSLLMPLDMDYKNMTNFGRNNNANALFQNLNTLLKTNKDGETLFEELLNNESLQESFHLYCRQIAFMIYNLDYTLDLDIVCLGGGISEQKLLLKTIQEEFSILRHRYKEDNHEPEIKVSTYKNEANLLGALYHYIKQKK